MTALDGHGIGDTGGVNPTSATAVFTLNPPATGINGVRIIGEDGGTADGNGFSDGLEVAQATDPRNPASYPATPPRSGPASRG